VQILNVTRTLHIGKPKQNRKVPNKRLFFHLDPKLFSPIKPLLIISHVSFTILNISMR
jgi:hypothetical protein